MKMGKQNQNWGLGREFYFSAGRIFMISNYYFENHFIAPYLMNLN